MKPAQFDPKRLISQLVVSAGLLLCAQTALANGRMPGANDVVFDALDPQHLLLRATFGLLRTQGEGGWQWICEQSIDTSGVVADPPIALTGDGSLVLLPPTGSALISHDAGCSWQRAAAPLAGRQGIDLTLHPREKGQVFALFSTVIAVDAGAGVYENQIYVTRDDARSWQLVATLPSDFMAETIELAQADPQRMYVSGTDNVDPRTGVLFVSDDGGAHFEKRTFALPAGTGSLLISGIHPTQPDLLWLRVPARGDTIGLLPARLFLSSDAGKSMHQIASTQRGMFGFALSPDGNTLAYGGPGDGLFVGPSDGSAGFEKRGRLGVRCLRWRESGALYACASEPADDFSLGVSDDQGMSFRALYALRDTCPALCSDGTQFAGACPQAWPVVRTALKAPSLQCEAPWAAPSDAGAAEAGTNMSELDASAPDDDAAAAPQDSEGESEGESESAFDAGTDASEEPPHKRSHGCGLHAGSAPVAANWGLLSLLGLLRVRGARRSRSA